MYRAAPTSHRPYRLQIDLATSVDFFRNNVWFSDIRSKVICSVRLTWPYVKIDIYCFRMKTIEKPLVWLHGEVKTPPLSRAARIETGYLLGLLQIGEKLSLPHSRSMPSIAPRCHELRINDETKIWRIIYRTDLDAIVILDVFEKKSQKTPKNVIENCRRRLRLYEE